MPLYDFECQVCRHRFEDVRGMSFTGPARCPLCRHVSAIKIIIKAPRVKVPDSGWEAENGGRGRYIGQLADRPDKTESFAFCRSQREAIDKAKRKGWQTIHKT